MQIILSFLGRRAGALFGGVCQGRLVQQGPRSFGLARLDWVMSKVPLPTREVVCVVVG